MYWVDDWNKLGIPEGLDPGPPIPPGGTIYHKDGNPPETPVPNPEGDSIVHGVTKSQT